MATITVPISNLKGVVSDSQTMNVSLGREGNMFISNVTDDFVFNSAKPVAAIQFIEDTKFKVLTDGLLVVVSGATITTNEQADAVIEDCVIFPVGLIIYGKFTAISLHSGSIKCYFGQ